MRAIWLALSVLPLWFHYIMASVCAVVVGKCLRYRRKVIIKNLTNAYPEKSAAEIHTICNEFYRFFADYLVETIKFATMSERKIRRHVTFKGAELIDDATGRGQSVALYLGHYGNWEWLTSMTLWFHTPSARGQVYHPLENDTVDRLFLAVRQRLGVTCVPMTSTVRWLHEARLAGTPSITGYISDQVPTWHNIHHWVTFMNQLTPVFTGTERIVRKYNQRAFYVDVRCVKRGYYECEFQPMTANLDSSPYALTEEYFSRLQNTINRAPAYWLWSHNRWKRTHEEFTRRFRVVNGHVVEITPSQ